MPIWKKEFFEDGSVWKENEESRRLLQPPPAPSERHAARGDAVREVEQ